ncbi:RNA-binding protein [Candidatus Peregrinibacteria bacterium]|nr:RNA-binding protein [Candidatus Peregrinibacteria bacterium]
MSKKLFVGNLNWKVTTEQLQELFEEFGQVEDAVIILDPQRRSKGFGFVTFANDEDADKAISELHEKEFEGRNMIVNEARPPKPRD